MTDNNNCLFSKRNHGWICFEKSDTGMEKIPITYAIDSANWADGFCLGIAKKEKDLHCSNEPQIFKHLSEVCNSLEIKPPEKNSWWLGFFLPKITT